MDALDSMRLLGTVGMHVLFYLLLLWSAGIAVLCMFYASATLREKRAAAGGAHGRDLRSADRTGAR